MTGPLGGGLTNAMIRAGGRDPFTGLSLAVIPASQSLDPHCLVLPAQDFTQCGVCASLGGHLPQCPMDTRPEFTPVAGTTDEGLWNLVKGGRNPERNYRILRRMEAEYELSYSEVGKAEGVTRNVVAGVVDRASGRGWVRPMPMTPRTRSA